MDRNHSSQQAGVEENEWLKARQQTHTQIDTVVVTRIVMHITKGNNSTLA